MALEHMIGIFLIGLLNWKVIKGLKWFVSDRSKMFLDIGTVVIVIAGVGMDFIGLFESNPYLYFPVLLSLEFTFVILGMIFGNLDKIHDLMNNPSSISALDV